MALSQFQFNTIMREYEDRRLKKKHELMKRLQEINTKFPRIKEIQDEISSLSISTAKRKLLSSESGNVFKDYKDTVSALISERDNILTKNGYSLDDINLQYECNDCKDTGYINSEKCHCLKNRIIELLYAQSNINEILKKENFASFDTSLYSTTLRDDITNNTANENILNVLSTCKNFVDNFDSTYQNLFIYGAPGVGKTFLTNCIAKCIIDKSFSVIYVSAIRLFDIMSEATFYYKKKDSSNEFSLSDSLSKDLLDCDLLIIDDLGTELVNSFTSSAFFNCINERYLRRKSIIISTNLSLGDLKNLYSERVFSRITSNYTLLKVFGEDLRIVTSLGLTK